MASTECIIDIGSASIGVCILEKGKLQPVVGKTVRTPISRGTEEAKAAIVDLTVQAVAKSLESFHKTASPQFVRVVLASPWYDAKIRTITTKSERPVRVTTETVVRTVKQYFAQKNESTQQGRTLLESVVSQAYVNGYPTAIKEALVGTSLRVNHYSSEADTQFVNQVTAAVKKTFPNAKVSFHSFAFVAFAALRALRDEENFVLLDVGGEITDVGVAHHDGFRFIGTFPIGTLSIIRAVAQGGSVGDVASRLTLYAKNELSNDENAAVGGKFSAASEEWKKNFKSLLETAAGEVAVPQTTFLFGDPEQLQWLESFISATHGAFSIRAIPVPPDFFQPFVVIEEEAFYDSFLCVESLYFHRNRDRLIEVRT